MNQENPIKTHSETTKLSTGTEVEVKASVYEKPIFPAGETVVYNKVQLLKDNEQWGVAFFQNPFEDEEMVDKVKEICENPDFYLAPAYKNK